MPYPRRLNKGQLLLLGWRWAPPARPLTYDDTGRARQVLHDDGLAKSARRPVGQQACHGVGRGTGARRSGRPVLRLRSGGTYAMAAPTSMLTKSFTSSSRKALVDYADAVRGSSSD